MNEGDLAPATAEAIRKVLRSHGEVREARLFGSRAKGRARPESDVDIAIFGTLDERGIEAIAEELDELPLPFHFDVLSYSSIKNRELRKHIDRVGVTIYRKEATEAAEKPIEGYGS